MTAESTLDDAAIRRFYRNLGARVRAARQAAALSQDQLADHLCMSRSSIANLEAGRQRIPAHILALILDVLNAAPSETLTGPAMWERVDEFVDLKGPLASTDEDTRHFVEAALASLNGATGGSA